MKRAPLLALALFAACTTTRSVSYTREVPAELRIDAIRAVAVADFDGLQQSGRIVASKIAAGIVEKGSYRLFEREKVNEILAEHAFSRSGVVDSATIHELKLAGVDALIFGTVDAYHVDEERGSSPEERRVRTGETRRIYYRDEDSGETKVREEDVYKTVIVQRPFLMRRGTVGVTFRMTNLTTGEIVAVEAMTANFNERGWMDGSGPGVPTKDEILDRLASEVVEKFLRKIQPHTRSASIDLEATRNAHSRLGANYAAAGLWERATAEFEAAAREEDDEAATHFNLAMAYFVLGRLDDAAVRIERAISIDPKQKYVNALASIEADRNR